MPDASAISAPPAATSRFREVRAASGFTLVRRDLAAAFERLADSATSSPDPFEQPMRAIGSIGGGRRPLAIVSIEPVGLRGVNKRLSRGGVLGPLFGGQAFPGRARREVAVDDILVAAGVPVVPLLAVRATRHRVLRFLATIDVLTEHVEHSADLLSFLRTHPAAAIRRRVIERAGEVVGAMHRAGVFHTDLNLRNLLVTPDENVLLLDFGASRIGGCSDAERAANLARLWRSCVKRGLAGAEVSRADAMRFLRGYAGERAHPWWRLARERFARSIALHRIGWWFTGRDPKRAPAAT